MSEVAGSGRLLVWIEVPPVARPRLALPYKVLDDPDSLEIPIGPTGILVGARAEDDFERRIILLKKALQMRCEVGFRAVQWLEQAYGGNKGGRSRRPAAGRQTHGAAHHQESVHGRGKDASDTDHEQKIHHALQPTLN